MTGYAHNLELLYTHTHAHAHTLADVESLCCLLVHLLMCCVAMGTDYVSTAIDWNSKYGARVRPTICHFFLSRQNMKNNWRHSEDSSLAQQINSTLLAALHL